MKKTAILLISLIVLLLGFLIYFQFIQAKIISINVIDSSYEETPILERTCSTCYLGYYLDKLGDQKCPHITQIDGGEVNDCQPHKEILCYSGDLFSSFNLQIKNYDKPATCELYSNGEVVGDLIEGYNGVNTDIPGFGARVDLDYEIEFCCYLGNKEKNKVCSNSYSLERQCYPGSYQVPYQEK
ncbi:hypothetical protein HN604_00740 [archaeon]|jgi:hypothetical protein|nr:hypothetical protein [archaeon]MBT6182651.1 hypothetical protein [archaeon]MBT6606657.1 hypothetical protein [archaeon]MBT7251900.1 hypothetical protein [archaeon]MBT7660592.1 hypothetical protein [archaeon]